MSHLGQSAWCIELARPRERGLKPERGAERAAAERSDRYDYQRAARDALHFAALFDRLIQNLRRLVGYDLQYFAAIEPQRRLAPHLHMAIRGTVSGRAAPGPRRHLPPGLVATRRTRPPR